MAKFGELVDIEVPVLIEFYKSSNNDALAMQPVLQKVATALGSRAKVLKIDVDKNTELAEALRIISMPTFMIYKKGSMKWRQTGAQDARVLVDLLQQFS